MEEDKWYVVFANGIGGPFDSAAIAVSAGNPGPGALIGVVRLPTVMVQIPEYDGDS